MTKMIFALLFTVLLSFIACRDEEYIKGLEALKQQFSNSTQYPEGYSKQIKSINIKSNKIEVQSITKDSDPTFLVKLGIEEVIAKDIIEEAEFSDSTLKKDFSFNFNITKKEYHVKPYGYYAVTVNLGGEKQYIAASSFECDVEIIPQIVYTKKCKKILGFKLCRTIKKTQPFDMTDELKQLIIDSIDIPISQNIVKQIDLKIQEQSKNSKKNLN